MVLPIVLHLERGDYDCVFLTLTSGVVGGEVDESCGLFSAITVSFPMQFTRYTEKLRPEYENTEGK